MENRKNKFIVALGSNFEQERNMENAMRRLRSLFPGIRFSRVLWTEPIGIVSDRFVNAVAVGDTVLSEEAVSALLKETEKSCGRCVEEKEKGVIRMDIDLMLYGGEKRHLKDWSRGYICTLLDDMGVFTAWPRSN